MNKMYRLSIACLLIMLLLYACQPQDKTKNTGQSEKGFRTEMSEQEKIALENLKKMLEKGMLAETIENANNFLARWPKNVDALNYRGLAKARNNDPHNGIKDFDEAIAIDPKFVRSYYNKGLAYYKLGDKTRARTCFDQAITIDPQDAKSYYSRGVLNFDETKKGEACQDWRKAKELGYEDRMDYLAKYCEGLGVPISNQKKK